MATKSLNRAQIIGNLGAEPELKMLNSGMAVCNQAVATSESWTDKNTGELKEATEWHRITLWGKLAEIANQYLHKRDKVFIEGKIKTRKWQDQNGNDRYSPEIHGDNLLMLGGKSQGGDGGGGQGYAQTPSGYQTSGPGYHTQGQGPGPPRRARRPGLRRPGPRRALRLRR